jgi:hypothetical protein
MYLLDLRRIREKATELKYLYLHFPLEAVFTAWNRRDFSTRQEYRNVLILFPSSTPQARKHILAHFVRASLAS